MKIRIDDTIYEGTGAEILEQLRLAAFDPTEFPDTESYLWQLRSNFIRMTDRDCVLPKHGLEEQARYCLGNWRKLVRWRCWKMAEGKLYFAYGSNINLDQMAQRCPDARWWDQSHWRIMNFCSAAIAGRRSGHHRSQGGEHGTRPAVEHHARV